MNVKLVEDLERIKLIIPFSAGEVSVVSDPNFDYEKTKLYTLMIKAFDGELLSKTGILRVKILNVNEAPRLPSSAVTLEMNEEEVTGILLKLKS